MTRDGSARLAGLGYLSYMAAGVAHQALISRATRAEGISATLARVAGHSMDLRVSILMALVEAFSALVVAVALFGVTRDESLDLALLALVCRVVEGVIGSMDVASEHGLAWLGAARSGAGALDPATTNAVGALLLLPGGPVGGAFFAVGSTIFSFLLLRGRMIPAPLAWLGVLSSALLAVGLPLQIAGFFTGPLTGYQWLPAIAFALALAPWLLIKGVATRAAP
jgi:hypothetical protein